MTARTTATAMRATAVLILAALLGAATPVEAAKSKKKKPAVSFFGKFSVRVIYDDNIIHYSDDDLHEFATVEAPGKFAIGTPDDWIVRPRLELGLSTRKITGKKLEILTRLSAWKYKENDVKNNESFWVRLKHMGFGSDNFQLAFYHAPEAYLRHFRDRAPFEPRSTVPYDYTEFSYQTSSLSLAYWRRLTKKIDGKFEVKRGWRYYNRAFMENDNWEWRYGGYVSWRFVRPLRLTADYYYSDVEARAADAAGETRENSDDGDGSYERDSYKVSLGVYLPRNLLNLFRVNFSGQYQAYFFTSRKDPEDDPYHVGRKDEILRFEVNGSTRPFLKHFTFEGGYRRTLRDSSAPWEGSEGESIDEDKDYKDNRFWAGMNYVF